MFLLPVFIVVFIVFLLVISIPLALIVLAFFGIIGIFVALAFAFKNRLLKSICVSPLGVQFLYYIPMHDYRVPKGFKSLDFIVNSTNDKLEIEVFNQGITFNNSEEFTLFLETFTNLFDLKF